MSLLLTTHPPPPPPIPRLPRKKPYQTNGSLNTSIIEILQCSYILLTQDMAVDNKTTVCLYAVMVRHLNICQFCNSIDDF